MTLHATFLCMQEMQQTMMMLKERRNQSPSSISYPIGDFQNNPNEIFVRRKIAFFVCFSPLTRKAWFLQKKMENGLVSLWKTGKENSCQRRRSYRLVHRGHQRKLDLTTTRLFLYGRWFWFWSCDVCSLSNVICQVSRLLPSKDRRGYHTVNTIYTHTQPMHPRLNIIFFSIIKN